MRSAWKRPSASRRWPGSPAIAPATSFPGPLRGQRRTEDSSRAFRALERGHVAGQITRPLRSKLVRALFLAEDRAREHFPVGLFDDRVGHACIAALGLLNRWVQPPGSNARVEAAREGMELVVRFVGNELDSLCAEAELRRILTAEAAVAASDHRATEGDASRG
jgi:hypothetical protein